MGRCSPTRPGFADTSKLRSLAKHNLDFGLVRLKNWWIRKYQLPPTHELFQGQSVAELELEFYEDMWAKKEMIEKELDEDTQGADRGELYRQLNSVHKALGLETESEDPLIDEWERDLAEGRIPDLEK
jgi:hypothetical protein